MYTYDNTIYFPQFVANNLEKAYRCEVHNTFSIMLENICSVHLRLSMVLNTKHSLVLKHQMYMMIMSMGLIPKCISLIISVQKAKASFTEHQS